MNKSFSVVTTLLLLLCLTLAVVVVVDRVNGQLSTVRAFLSDSDLNNLLTRESPLFAKEIEAQKIPDMQLKGR